MFSSTMELSEARELRMSRNSGRAWLDSWRAKIQMNGVTQASARASRQSMANITQIAPTNITTQSRML